MSATRKCSVATSRSLRRDHMRGVENAGIVDVSLARILVDPFLDLVTEMRDQALDRPRRGVTERADGVPFPLFCPSQGPVDPAFVGPAFAHPGQAPPHPPGALAAW